MAKYIDREALVEWLKRIPLKDLSDGLWLCRVIMEDDFKKAIKKMPKGIIVDISPVRHGRWLTIGYACGETEYQCSVCKETEWRISSSRLKYCPFCGAKMDLEMRPEWEDPKVIYWTPLPEPPKEEKIMNERRFAMNVVLDEGAYLPTRAHEHDAGYDLYSREDAVIFQNASGLFDTGVHMEIPAGYVGFLKSKSGLNVKSGIQSEGVIDSGYTGSIMVKLYNHSEKAVEIKKGQKISQLVILPVLTPELTIVDSLEETERGNGGFGSTGKF